MTPPPLAVTMGEPAGIGGEILLKSWSLLRHSGPPFLAIDDPQRLRRIAASLRLDIPVAEIGDPVEAGACFANAVPVLALGAHVDAIAGQPTTATAPMVIAAIEQAVQLACRDRIAGVVTNPIQKSVLYAAGFRFPGHTEYLGALSGTTSAPIMMLIAGTLRVVPVTIHVSLKTAIERLSTALIVDHAMRTADALKRDFGIERPRVAVLGLNPHAGEDGSMGREDIDVIAPAVRQLLVVGLEAFGPLPPDTAFSARARQSYDVAICMYHDQALIPVKTIDMDGGVNVSLGLPFVPTSPDHGTALDIAGRGTADPGSLVAAIRLAAHVATHRQKAVAIQRSLP